MPGDRVPPVRTAAFVRTSTHMEATDPKFRFHYMTFNAPVALGVSQVDDFFLEKRPMVQGRPSYLDPNCTLTNATI